MLPPAPAPASRALLPRNKGGGEGGGNVDCSDLPSYLPQGLAHPHTKCEGAQHPAPACCPSCQGVGEGRFGVHPSDMLGHLQESVQGRLKQAVGGSVAKDR